jgi:hypothetical protein
MRIIAIIVLALLLAFGSCSGKYKVTSVVIDEGEVSQVLVNGKWFEITERYTEVEDENGMTKTQKENVRVYLYE